MRGVSHESPDSYTNPDVSALYISVPSTLSSCDFSSPTSSSSAHGSPLDSPDSPYPIQSIVRERPAARQQPTRLRPQGPSSRLAKMHSTQPPQTANADIPLAAPIAFDIAKRADGIPLALPVSSDVGQIFATPAAESRHVVGLRPESDSSSTRVECSNDVSTPDLYPSNRPRPRHRRSASATQPSTASQTFHIFTQTYEYVECRYTLKDKLGDGFMGVVYRCTEKKTGQSWACKTIQKSKLSCREDVAGLRDEVAALRILRDHSAVVSLHDVVEDEDVRPLPLPPVSVSGRKVNVFCML